ncbi:Hypothetical predicted protein [Paramuricea clavata]|uniref:Uncharacterized protein n=1 Tax=Paramuricea clavata TaxID=317549 RepID=A0A7D9L0N5_PARCT|nr:Hypothetical predicted protein [Paramuricea clavata]
MDRPESKTQTNPIDMSTLLLKLFPNIKAVSQERINLLPKSPVKIPSMKFFITNNMQNVSKTYAESMPYWVVGKYFNPESERQRLLVNDYQQTEVKEMRRMNNTKLVDSIELPLKSCENVLTAINKMLSSGLELCLDHFIAPFVGNWPKQFFIRRLVYCDAPSLPAALQNIVPLIAGHHYNKALLVNLSLFQHWEENTHSMFETARQYIVAFDEYPVENFHSVLRARTKETDSADQIAFKAKEIDACKHELHNF